MKEKSIVPECYVDTKLAEILGQASKKYNHQHGCGDVANELETELKDNMALAIVDEDLHKGAKPKYFSEFILLMKEGDLILKKHKTLKQYLILICPEIEKWLTSNANDVGVDLSFYNLPLDLKGLVKLTKIKDIDKNEDFKRFVKALIRSEAPGIITLKNWIELFKSNQLDSLKSDAI